MNRIQRWNYITLQGFFKSTLENVKEITKSSKSSIFGLSLSLEVNVKFTRKMENLEKNCTIIPNMYMESHIFKCQGSCELHTI